MANDDEEAFRRAIAANPGDKTARLAYADWQDEHDNPDRAELIRVQCELEQAKPGSREHKRLQKRSEELLSKHLFKDGNVNPESDEQRVTENGREVIYLPEFRAGFIEEATADLEPLARHAKAVFEANPLRILHLHNHARHNPDPHVATLCAVPNIAGLRELHADRIYINDPGVASIANCPHLQNLEVLDLAHNGFGVRGAQAIARSPYLKNLHTLNLNRNYIYADGVEALAASPNLSTLRKLDIGANDTDDRGVIALANSPHLSNLRELNLAYCRWLGYDSARAVAGSRTFGKLETLDMTQGDIRTESWQTYYSPYQDAGLYALAWSPYLSSLKEIRLSEEDTAIFVNHLREAWGRGGLSLFSLERINRLPLAEYGLNAPPAMPGEQVMAQLQRQWDNAFPVIERTR